MSDTEEILRGTLERVTYRNPENGYAVLQVAVADKRERVTVVGTCLTPRVGVDLVIRGVFVTHPKFGKQMSASSITETVPTSSDGLERYLSSGLIKGIGEKTARRIVEHLGDEALEVMHRDPEELARVPGVGSKKAVIIHQALSHQRDMGAVMQFLVENNVSPRLATRIYERYRNRSIEVLKKDPYVLARQMKGIGFATADSIAINLGVLPSSPERLRAGLYFALERAADDGHCYVPEGELYKRALHLLGLEEGFELEDPLHQLLAEGVVVTAEGRIALRHIFEAEVAVIDFIRARTMQTTPLVAQDSAVEASLVEATRELDITLSAQQRDAVQKANRFSFLLITGGPGCGKTTVIRALSRFFFDQKNILVLAAPTGRAAQRMSHVCGVSASTIHRLLKYDPQTGGFQHHRHNPIIADVVIVDESSMIDVLLARDLFSAIPETARVILIGDKDQLPSVGPGRVFADLLGNKDIPSVVLSQLFRRSEGSSITHVAHLINSGIVPEIPEPDGVTKTDTYFLPRKSSEDAASLIERLVADQIPQKFGIPSHDITVLSPSNRGPLGTVSLNTLLQARLNPPKDPEQEVSLNENTFRLGDKVCQRVNNYNIDTFGVFNGDAGVVYSVHKKERSLVVELWDGRLITYEYSDLSQLSLAYAVTVHRSQGSEIRCVVLALDNAHFTLLERQLLYTAVTRAKELLIIVGSRQALSVATKKATSLKRYTSLRGAFSQIC